MRRRTESKAPLLQADTTASQPVDPERPRDDGAHTARNFVLGASNQDCGGSSSNVCSKGLGVAIGVHGAHPTHAEPASSSSPPSNSNPASNSSPPSGCAPASIPPASTEASPAIHPPSASVLEPESASDVPASSGRPPSGNESIFPSSVVQEHHTPSATPTHANFMAWIICNERATAGEFF